MRAILLSTLVLSLMFTSSQAQRRRSIHTEKISLGDTTWQVYYRSNRSDSWGDFGQLHFLPSGIVEEITPKTGYRCRGGRWNAVAGNLRIVEGDLDCKPALIRNMVASIGEREMMGSAVLGMNPRGFYVRLMRIDESKAVGSLDSVQRERSPASHILPRHRPVLQKWLDSRPTWRPATLDDAFAGTDREGTEFLKGEIKSKGNNYHPYYAVGDFNRDGDEDFAVIIKNKTKLAIAIFNGPFGSTRNPPPAFYSETVGQGSWLFWVTDDQFGRRFIVGPPASDAGYIIRPHDKHYKLEAP
jgi:hypothetical protein